MICIACRQPKHIGTSCSLAMARRGAPVRVERDQSLLLRIAELESQVRLLEHVKPGARRRSAREYMKRRPK